MAAEVVVRSLAASAIVLRLTVIGVVVAVAWRAVGSRRRQRARLGLSGSMTVRRRRRPEDPEALVMLAAALARALRGGATVSGAVLDVGVRSEGRAVVGFEEVAGRLRIGHPLGEALGGWCAARPDSGGRLLGAALLVAAHTGAGAAAAVDGVSAGLVAEWETVLEQRSVTSQARASAGVLVALPPLAAVILGVGSGDLGVWVTPLGVVCLAVGLCFEVAGVAWMRILIRRALDGPR